MGSISIFLLFSLPYTIPLSVSLPAFLGFCVCVCVLFFKEADTQTEMHMHRQTAQCWQSPLCPLGHPRSVIFWYFLSMCFSPSLLSAKQRAENSCDGFALLCFAFPFSFCICFFFFFSSSRLRVFGVFVSVGIDEHIPNKPVSSAYVRF